jgi:RNA recognition motif-containing protein
MSKKLYVGNLSYSATEEEVRELFSEVGTVVSVSMITDRETGKPRGFAFVEMQTDEEAAAALDELNGRELRARTITVAEARPRQGRPGGERRERGGFSRRPDQRRR